MQNFFAYKKASIFAGFSMIQDFLGLD